MLVNREDINNAILNWARAGSYFNDIITKYSDRTADILGNSPLSIAVWWIAALWLSVSIASASIPEKNLANEMRRKVENVNIFSVTRWPANISVKKDWKYTTIKPESFREVIFNWSESKTNNSSNTNIKSKPYPTTLGSTLIDSLTFSENLHNKINEIVWVNANIFYKSISKQESNCWDNMFRQLDLALQAQDVRAIKQWLWTAVNQIQWTHNDIWLLQITPWFWALKNVDWPIVASRNDLKMQIYWVFLYYSSPELFQGAMNNVKVNSPHTIALLNNVKSHIENYLRENNKTQINKWDLFNILSRIDVRFDNQKMWEVVMYSFIDEYKKVTAANPNLSKNDRIRLVFNRYNQWTNATVWAHYASIIQWNIRRFANWNPSELAEHNLQAEPKQQASVSPVVWIQDAAEIRAPVIPVSSPMVKLWDSTYCSRTAENNLKKFLPGWEELLNWDAKSLVHKLLKKSKATTAQDIISIIEASDDNVFDVYINNQLWHRMILVKNWNDIFVLDPYYTNTKKWVPVTQYKPFELTWKHFVLGPSYTSPLFKTADQKVITPQENTVTNSWQETIIDSPQATDENIRFISHTNKATHTILTSKAVMDWITDSRMRESIATKLNEAPLDVQIAHYIKDPKEIQTLKKLYTIDLHTKNEQLVKSKEQLKMVNFVEAKLSASNPQDDFSKIKLKKLWDAKYTLVNQIAVLENSINQIKENDVYRYDMAV